MRRPAPPGSRPPRRPARAPARARAARLLAATALAAIAAFAPTATPAGAGGGAPRGPPPPPLWRRRGTGPAPAFGPPPPLTRTPRRSGRAGAGRADHHQAGGAEDAAPAAAQVGHVVGRVLRPGVGDLAEHLPGAHLALARPADLDLAPLLDRLQPHVGHAALPPRRLSNSCSILRFGATAFERAARLRARAPPSKVGQ